MLIAGFLLFGVGAVFWKPAVYQQELPLALPEMAIDRERLRWIYTWMSVGVTVTALGIALLAVQMVIRDEVILSILAAGLFGLGAAAWIIALLFRVTVGLWAAEETSNAGSVPLAFEAWSAWADSAYRYHMATAYVSWALIGGGLLVTGLTPAWLGWAGVALGAIMSIGLVALRGGPFSPPILAHVYPAAVGIALLV
jgi:hypothetical protein